MYFFELIIFAFLGILFWPFLLLSSFIDGWYGPKLMSGLMIIILVQFFYLSGLKYLLF